MDVDAILVVTILAVRVYVAALREVREYAYGGKLRCNILLIYELPVEYVEYLKLTCSYRGQRRMKGIPRRPRYQPTASPLYEGGWRNS